MQVLYILYQYFIALPIYIVLTIFTAVMTIICFPFKNAEFIHKIQQFWASSFCWLLFIPVRIEGNENIPQGESVVFVCNHQSLADVLVIYGHLPVIFKWIMKKELRLVPFIGSACAAAGHIFIDRKNRRAAAQSIKDAEKVLHDGICVVIFPEGTRTHDGQIQRFKRGAVQIAFDLNLRIVPMALIGCYDVMPRNKFYAKHHPITMRIGQPVDLQGIEDQQQAIELLHEKVIELIKA